MTSNPDRFDSTEQKVLLEIARQTIASRQPLRDQPPVEAEEHPRLRLERAVFVTLNKLGRLRGCIGHLEPRWPLWRSVSEMAYSAAFQDPRFPPVAPSEVPDLEIEISVLSLPQPVEDFEEIVIGRDGLIVEKQGYRGVLLPQVATERGWDRQTFLEQTCRKAGLDPDEWKDPRTRFYRFEAFVFGEKDFRENERSDTP